MAEALARRTQNLSLREPPGQQHKFLQRRPGHGTKGKPVELTVNYFRLKFNQPLRLHEYTVDITDFALPRASGRGRGRGGRGRGGQRATNQTPKEEPVKNVDVLRAAFWSAVRKYLDEFGDAVTFDDEKTCWTMHALPIRPGRPFMHEMEHPLEEKRDRYRVRVRISLSLLGSFVVDLLSERDNGIIADSSRRAIKSIFTQGVRYAPGPGERREGQIHFVDRWAKAGGSVYAIPAFMGRPKIEVRVCPGVRNWLGLYASVKSIENLDTVMNWSLVNKLFYELDMDLVTFYCEVLEEKNLLNVENYSEKLREFGMNANQRRNLESKLDKLRVKAGGFTKQGEPRLGGALVCDYKKNRDGALVRKGEWFLAERHFPRILQVMDFCASSHYLDNGRTMTEMYFLLGYTLKFPYLPLVKVKNGKDEFFQPLEVLYTHDTPQRYAGFLDFPTRRKYIQNTCRDPEEYKQLTDRLIASLEICGNDLTVNAFGIAMNPEMMKCNGRVMEAPTLRNNELKAVEIQEDRVYRQRTMNQVPKPIVFSVIIVLSPKNGMSGQDREQQGRERKEKIGVFYNGLERCTIHRGIPVSSEQPRVVEAQAFSEQREMCLTDDDLYIPRRGVEDIRCVRNVPTIALAINELKHGFEKRSDKNEKSHVVLLFSERHYGLYGRIKSICDVQLGVVSQVVDYTTVISAVEKKNEAIYYNLALKINAKLGGVNIEADAPWTEPVEFEPETKNSPTPPSIGQSVMYIGIDVTHPSPGSGIDISIASMVGNYNMEATRYSSEIYAQMKARETVECFDKQFQQLMFKYFEQNNCYPEHVVVYRDGVSNSEMLKTASLEVRTMQEHWKRATADLSDEHSPPTFTYIVVQKRHGTRFMRESTAVETGQPVKVNPNSGTVVDQMVSSPKWFDFWLYGQNGFTLDRSSGKLLKAKCTNVPAHYTVVYDEWQLTPDQIYEMTYRLCFLYARCRKPVSIPTPVYYAHLACEKAKEIYKDALETGRIRQIDLETSSPMQLLQQKELIERMLKVHSNYTGMHFV